MQKPQFVNNEIYHIYNRGVEKRDLFLGKTDYLRFIHDLFEFNNENPCVPSNIRFSSRHPSEIADYHLKQCLEVGPPNIGDEKKPRRLLVEILVFCLMPNHFHLILKQKKENGIVRFMQKLGTGYSMYFNEKQKRVGPLFQGRFKAVHVNEERYFDYLPYYIHFNSLDLIEPKWREGKIENYQEAIKFLNSYLWSSHLDYIGKRNFPSITQREFLLDIFDGEENYKKSVKKWLKEMSKIKEENIDEFKVVTLE